MVLLLGIVNVFVCFCGIYRTFKRQSILLFCWLIFLYFGIVSLLVCAGVGEYNVIFRSYFYESFNLETKLILLSNMLFCNLGFLVVEFFQRKKKFQKINFSFLNYVWVKILTATMYISLVFVFLHFYGHDYLFFVSSDDGGGWGLIFFQISVCSVIFLFNRKKWKLLFAVVFCILLIVTTTHVRSLLLYPIFPIVLYVLYNWLFEIRYFKQFIKRILILSLLLLGVGFGLSIIRFGTVRIPESNLPSISMQVIEYAGMNGVEVNTSIKNYAYGFVSPFLIKLGVNYTPPQSVPHYNAAVCYGANFSSLDDAAHFPAMIYHDLYVNYGYYSVVAALFFYLYLSFICSYLQTNKISFYLLSAIIPWHLYMLIRGSTDYSSMGVAYSLIIALLLSALISHALAKHKASNIVSVNHLPS